MADVQDKGTSGGSTSAFTKKLGPLPVWVWMAGGLGVALIIAMMKSKKSNASAASSAATQNATAAEEAQLASLGTQTPPYVAQNYASSVATSTPTVATSAVTTSTATRHHGRWHRGSPQMMNPQTAQPPSAPPVSAGSSAGTVSAQWPQRRAGPPPGASPGSRHPHAPKRPRPGQQPQPQIPPELAAILYPHRGGGFQ